MISLTPSNWFSKDDHIQLYLKRYNVFKPVILKPPSPLLYIAQLSTVGKYSGEGNGTPLKYSCLETPVDGGAC